MKKYYIKAYYTLVNETGDRQVLATYKCAAVFGRNQVSMGKQVFKHESDPQFMLFEHARNRLIETKYHESQRAHEASNFNNNV